MSEKDLAHMARTLFTVIVGAAALKAALGTLSRPMQGAGIAPSIRNQQRSQSLVEDYEGPEYDEFI